MRNKDILAISFKNGIRKKSYFIQCTIFILIFMLIFFTYNFYDCITQFINNNINNNIEYKSKIVMFEKGTEEYYVDKIKAIDHVVSVTHIDNYEIYVASNINNKNYEISFIAGNIKMLPKLTYGRHFKEGDDNVAICPENIYLNNNLIGINNQLNMKDYLNKEISITYDSYDYLLNQTNNTIVDNIEIIGLYKTASNYTSINQCFAPNDKVLKMTNLKNNNLYDVVDKNKTLVVTIDDIKNVDFVVKKLNELDLNIVDKAQIDTELVIILYTMVSIILIIMLLFFYFLINLYNSKNIKDNIHQIGIYKSIGYTDDLISKIYNCEQFQKVSISFIVSISFYAIIYFIIKYVLKNSLSISTVFSLSYPIIFMIILYFTSIMMLYLNMKVIVKKIRKINVIDILEQ